MTKWAAAASTSVPQSMQSAVDDDHWPALPASETTHRGWLVPWASVATSRSLTGMASRVTRG